MRRMTVLDHPEHVMGGEIYYREDKYRHDPELQEAYECGKRDGWRCAMEEIEQGGYNERHHYSRGSMPPMFREHERDYRKPEDDEVMYRRRRANGRFY